MTHLTPFKFKTEYYTYCRVKTRAEQKRNEITKAGNINTLTH